MKGDLPVEQLVDFAVSSGVHEDRPLAACQALSQVHAHGKVSLPERALYGFALNLDVNPLWFDAFVCRDRSDGKRNSAPQSCGHQLNRAGVAALIVIPAVNMQYAIADLHLGPIPNVTNRYRFTNSHRPLNTLKLSSPATSGISMGRLQRRRCPGLLRVLPRSPRKPTRAQRSPPQDS